MKRSIRVLAVAMTSVFFLGSVADAHVRIEPTRLTLRVSDRRVDKGDKVVFTGHLKSAWNKCYAFQPVKLIRNGVVRASRKTNSTGIVKFIRHLRHSGYWHLKYRGRRWGLHPHRHVCRPSASNIVHIVVKNP